MANARRGISELLRSGKGKRFRSSGYDLLADGEDLVRSDRDEDDDEQDERPAKGSAARKGAQATVDVKKPIASKSTSGTITSNSKSRHDAESSKPQARAGASSRDDVKVASSSSKQIVAKKDTIAKTATVSQKAIVAKSATETPKKVVAKAATVAKKDMVAKSATISEVATTKGKAGTSPSPEVPPVEVVAKKDTVAKSDTVRSVHAWLPSGHVMVSQSATIAKVDTTSKAALIDQTDVINDEFLADDEVVAESVTIAESEIISKAATDRGSFDQQGIDGVIAELATSDPEGVAASDRSGMAGAKATSEHPGSQVSTVAPAFKETDVVVAKSDTIAVMATSVGGQPQSMVVANADTSADSATIAEIDTDRPKSYLHEESLVSESATIKQDHHGGQYSYSSQSSYSDPRVQVSSGNGKDPVSDSATVAKKATTMEQEAAPATKIPSGREIVADSVMVAERAANVGAGFHTGAPGTGGRPRQSDSSQNRYYHQNGDYSGTHGAGGREIHVPRPDNGMVPNSATVAERATTVATAERSGGWPQDVGHGSQAQGQVVAKSAMVPEKSTIGTGLHQKSGMLIAESATVANSATHAATSNIPDHGVVPLPFWVLRMIRQDELSMREIRVFLTILEECIASGTGSAEISANDLMTRTQIHRTHIFSSVKGLLEKNLIVKDKTDAASKNVYRLNFDVGSVR